MKFGKKISWSSGANKIIPLGAIETARVKIADTKI